MNDNLSRNEVEKIYFKNHNGRSHNLVPYPTLLSLFHSISISLNAQYVTSKQFFTKNLHAIQTFLQNLKFFDKLTSDNQCCVECVKC